MNLIDEFTCQALGIDIDSLPAERIFCLLDQVKAWRALPMTIRVDNGPEFVAEALADWVSGTACCGASSQGQPHSNRLNGRANRSFRNTSSTAIHLNRWMRSGMPRGRGCSTTPRSDPTTPRTT